MKRRKPTEGNSRAAKKARLQKAERLSAIAKTRPRRLIRSIARSMAHREDNPAAAVIQQVMNVFRPGREERRKKLGRA